MSTTNFTAFRNKLIDHFRQITANVDKLYEIDCDKNELWNLYLDSFPTGTNEIYRERRAYDCVCCRNFIRTMGNVCVIKDNQIHTIWGFDAGNDTFQPVVDAMDAYLKARPVADICVIYDQKIGTETTYQETEHGIIEWSHFVLNIPQKFRSSRSRTSGDIKGEFRDTRNVFKRSLDEISMDAIDTVLELIADGSLYRGEEWKAVLQQFRTYHAEYDKLTASEKENYAWEKVATVGGVIGRIRNHSIGTLLTDITNNEDLETAVKSFERMVAPANYKRPKAIFTAKMLESAKQTLTELGYMNSLGRRYATLDDITVNNILFCNKNAKKRVHGASDVFDALMSETAHSPKKFDRVEEVTIDRFMEEILPTAQSIEAYVENRHAGNFVSLIAPTDPDAPSMFKWDNAFGWAYAGNITDSDIRANVKAAGGAVDGVLRFSIQWNDGDNFDENDNDAHCITPDEAHIFFGTKRDSVTGGNLDVDIIYPENKIAAVENITFPAMSSLKPGNYKFYVNCYSSHGGSSGFRAEIEANGEVHSYNHTRKLRTGQTVNVAVVHYDGHGKFTIVDNMEANAGIKSKDIWNISTNTFIPVTTVMYSPNYWDEQKGNGNRHWFFMLDGCINPEQPNGFYNEFLKPELIPHRKVFEALGAKLSVAAADDQLSGVGFSSTQRNDLIVKVAGAVERTLKIKF